MNNSALSLRQQKVVNGILKGKSGPQSAFEAGYSPSYARKYRVAEHKGVRNALTVAMKRKGITENRLAEVMADGLKATKLFATQEGVSEVTDFSVRHKYVETSLKIMGYLKDATIQQELGIICLPSILENNEWSSANTNEGQSQTTINTPPKNN